MGAPEDPRVQEPEWKKGREIIPGAVIDIQGLPATATYHALREMLVEIYGARFVEWRPPRPPQTEDLRDRTPHALREQRSDEDSEDSEDSEEGNKARDARADEAMEAKEGEAKTEEAKEKVEVGEKM